MARRAKFLSVFLPAAAMAVIVALLEAISWVGFHRGFGRGDLTALAIWSLPFGGFVATAAVVFRRTERPRVRALRVFVAATVGAALGLVWTLLMLQMMGAWFGTFSFPILPILSSSGALTLVLFASQLPKSVVAPSS